MTRLISVALVLAFLPTAAAAAPGPACGELDFVRALSHLRGSAGVDVLRRAGAVTVVDRANDRVLVTVGRCGVRDAGPTLPSRETRDQARTEVVTDKTGARQYSRSLSRLGAHLTVIEPGVVDKLGLHVTVFDNDDVHVSDGAGDLVLRVKTEPDGTLIQSEGAAYGCGCERVTAPDGHAETRPLR